MGVAARVAQPALRVFQVICSAIVLGILGHFLHELQQAGVSRDGRIIYGVVVGSISLAFALIFVLPMMYSFLAFPGDFILFVMWLVLFCLLISVSCLERCSGYPRADAFAAHRHPHMRLALVLQLLEILLGRVVAAPLRPRCREFRMQLLADVVGILLLGHAGIPRHNHTGKSQWCLGSPRGHQSHQTK